MDTDKHGLGKESKNMEQKMFLREGTERTVKKMEAKR